MRFAEFGQLCFKDTIEEKDGVFTSKFDADMPDAPIVRVVEEVFSAKMRMFEKCLQTYYITVGVV